MGGIKEHQQLLDEIMMAIGSLPHVRIWPRYVGYDKDRHIKYGIKGESDLQGIIAPYGRMLAIEIKTGTGHLSKDQIRWRDMIIRFGGLYIEARSLQDVLGKVLETSTVTSY